MLGIGDDFLTSFHASLMTTFRHVRLDPDLPDAIEAAAETIYAAVYLEAHHATATLLWRWMPLADFERRTI